MENNNTEKYNKFSFENLYKKFVEILNENSTIVEVGCLTGNSICCLASEIEKSKKKINLYAVDTWEGSLSEPEMMESHLVKNKLLYDAFISNITNKGLDKYVNVVRKSSVEASKDFEDNSIDIVFIDADHTFESVCEDIDHWYPKVKTGGIISGHDYSPYVPGHGGWTTVFNAVNVKFVDFIKKYKTYPQIPNLCGDCWVAVKENEGKIIKF